MSTVSWTKCDRCGKKIEGYDGCLHVEVTGLNRSVDSRKQWLDFCEECSEAFDRFVVENEHQSPEKVYSILDAAAALHKLQGLDYGEESED